MTDISFARQLEKIDFHTIPSIIIRYKNGIEKGFFVSVFNLQRKEFGFDGDRRFGSRFCFEFGRKVNLYILIPGGI
jgi:hypothetical protein